MSDKAKSEADSFWSRRNLTQLFLLILAVFALRWSIAQPYEVPTASMEPTIKVGDRLLAVKFAYALKLPFTDIELVRFGKPKRGDIIVFKHPQIVEQDYVKRVLAVEGDRIEIKNGIVIVNDVPSPLTEHEKDRSVLDDIVDNGSHKLLFREKTGDVDHWMIRNRWPAMGMPESDNWSGYGSNSGPYIVPEGHVLGIGDNRDNSADSRKWGPVPIPNIHGKLVMVLWSAYKKEDSTLPTFRFYRFGHMLD